MTCPLSMGLIRNQIQILFGSANACDQRLATNGLSTPPDFFASPLHCLVRLTEIISWGVVGRTPTSCRWLICPAWIRQGTAFGAHSPARCDRLLR